ncbi:hypothetical protein C8F04DRAFT_721489 [Mycena alexandri]|uniref:Uncharacterized protein n=1 Tax=Mycena alexandri TaxID=1745969 RepID=A0AAD6XB91_9AGAR|nr:hypothetical protein C8F04DRAFT_721489 [Mycena alexandri]
MDFILWHCSLSLLRSRRGVSIYLVHVPLIHVRFNVRSLCSGTTSGSDSESESETSSSSGGSPSSDPESTARTAVPAAGGGGLSSESSESSNQSSESEKSAPPSVHSSLRMRSARSPYASSSHHLASHSSCSKSVYFSSKPTFIYESSSNKKFRSEYSSLNLSDENCVSAASRSCNLCSSNDSSWLVGI